MVENLFLQVKMRKSMFTLALILLSVIVNAQCSLTGWKKFSQGETFSVALKEDGTYFLEYKNQTTGPVTLEALTQTLIEAQSTAESENKVLNVVINGHTTRPYGDVMALMSSLQDAGLSHVGLLTKPLE